MLTNHLISLAVVRLSSKRHSCSQPLPVDVQAPSLHDHYSFPSYYEPVRLPAAAAQTVIASRPAWLALVRTQSPQHDAGSPRFRDRSLHTRCPLSPRKARRLRLPIASPPLLGFTIFGRLAAFTSLTRPNRVRFRYGSRDSPREASWTALLRPTLAWLPVKRAITGSGLSPDQISPALPGAPKDRRDKGTKHCSP